MRIRLPVVVLIGGLSLAGAGALAQAEAERRLDNAIERLRAALGPDARLEIGGRSVDPVSGSARLTDVVLIEGTNRLTVPEVRLAELEDTRIGRAELLRTVYRGADGASGEIARIMIAGLPVPVAGKTLDFGNLSFAALEVEAARMADPAKGAMRLARLEVREWTPRGVASGALEGFEYRDAAPDPQVMRLGRVVLDQVTLPLTATQDFDPTAFRAGRIGLEGAELRDPAQQVTLSLGRIDLRDWVPGQPAALVMERLDVAAPAGGMGQVGLALGRFEAAGIDAPGAVAAVMGGLQIPDPFPGTLQRVALEGLDASWDGQQVVTLARLATEGALADGIARGALTAEGLRVVPPAGQADWLEALGYREILGGLELRASSPREGGRLEVEPFRIAWQEAATVTLAAQLDGIPGAPAPGTPMNPDATAAAFAAAELGSLTLTLRDHGLLGRLLARQAREQRMPEARLREQWAQMAMAMPLPGERPARGQRGGPPPKGTATQGPDPLLPMREALANFVRQPGTLEITLRPPKPLTLEQISDLSAEGPVQAVQRLGLSIVAR